jgi:hypothetical protein
LLTIAARRSSSSWMRLGQTIQGHLDHAERAGDDLRLRRDHGLGMLPAQHRPGELRRAGEMRELGVDDDDAGLREALPQLVAQRRRDLLGVETKCHLGGARRARLLEVVDRLS